MWLKLLIVFLIPIIILKTKFQFSCPKYTETFFLILLTCYWEPRSSSLPSCLFYYCYYYLSINWNEALLLLLPNIFLHIFLTEIKMPSQHPGWASCLTYIFNFFNSLVRETYLLKSSLISVIAWLLCSKFIYYSYS